MATKIRWFLGASLALVLGYVLCGHVFLFLHGMGQWPIILSVFGLLVIAVAAFTNSRKTMALTVAGYVIGFAAGMLFHWDTYHPQRGPGVYTNNNWAIWTVVYLLFIVAGIVWDVLD